MRGKNVTALLGKSRVLVCWVACSTCTPPPPPPHLMINATQLQLPGAMQGRVEDKRVTDAKVDLLLLTPPPPNCTFGVFVALYNSRYLVADKGLPMSMLSSSFSPPHPPPPPPSHLMVYPVQLQVIDNDAAFLFLKAATVDRSRGSFGDSPRVVALLWVCGKGRRRFRCWRLCRGEFWLYFGFGFG